MVAKYEALGESNIDTGLDMTDKALKRNKAYDKLINAWGKKHFSVAYLENWSEEDLEDLIPYLSDFYYNEVEDPLIDDEDFDKLWVTLKRRNPKSKVFKKARAPVKPTRQKVKLQAWMSSLDKLYPGGGIDKWQAKQNVESYVLADKLDGFSIEVSYDSKGKKHIVSGGDGVYGQDLAHLNNAFSSLPESGVKNLTVRCEGVMIKSKFALMEKTFKTSRSALSNVFNNATPNSDAIKATRLVALEITKPAGMPLAQQYAKLKALGFLVPTFKIVHDLDEEELRVYYTKRRAKSLYPIDGIVITANKTYTLSKSGNPKYAVAFKENSADSIVEATVIAVEGNVSRTGRLVPLVHIKPVKINGVTISKLTGHNFGYIRDNMINKGSVINITRSGEVIPYIVNVIKPSKTWATPKGEEGSEWYWATDLDIKTIANTAEAKDEMAIKKLAYFASVMGIEGLKYGMATSLYYGGITSPYKLVKNYSTKTFENIGLGKTQSRILNENIDDVIGSGVELPLLATALSAFGVGIGYNKIKAIDMETSFESLKDLSSEKRIDIIQGIRGFSVTTAEVIESGIDRLFAWIEKSGVTILSVGVAAPVSDLMSGNSILFSGFRSAELEDWIKRNGGSIATTMTKATMLLIKDVTAPPTSKVTLAIDKGIPVVSVSSFIKKYVDGKGTDLERLKI